MDTGKCVDASPLLVHLPTSAYKHTLHSVVYIGSHSGMFLAIDWELGLVLWRAQLGDRIESSATMSSCGRYVAVGQWHLCVCGVCVCAWCVCVCVLCVCVWCVCVCVVCVCVSALTVSEVLEVYFFNCGMCISHVHVRTYIHMYI